jgi:hypothetical protein
MWYFILCRPVLSKVVKILILFRVLFCLIYLWAIESYFKIDTWLLDQQ